MHICYICQRCFISVFFDGKQKLTRVRLGWDSAEQSEGHRIGTLFQIQVRFERGCRSSFRVRREQGLGSDSAAKRRNQPAQIRAQTFPGSRGANIYSHIYNFRLSVIDSDSLSAKA